MGKIQRLTLDDINDKDSKIGVFDIETGGLNVDFNRFLSLAICDIKATKPSQVTVLRVDETDKKHRPGSDVEITKQTVKLLNQYEYLVTYNGKWFDIPMITAFALRNRLHTMLPSIRHVDLYQLNRKRFRFANRSLHNLLTSMKTKVEKFHIDPEDWRYATAGCAKALDRIVKHNIHDVLSLAEVTRIIAEVVPVPWQYIR